MIVGDSYCVKKAGFILTFELFYTCGFPPLSLVIHHCKASEPPSFGERMPDWYCIYLNDERIIVRSFNIHHSYLLLKKIRKAAIDIGEPDSDVLLFYENWFYFYDDIDD